MRDIFSERDMSCDSCEGRLSQKSDDMSFMCIYIFDIVWFDWMVLRAGPRVFLAIDVNESCRTYE